MYCEEYEVVTSSDECSVPSARSACVPPASHSMTSNVRGSSPQSPSKHITVVDVYDLAAAIGSDFEKIIEQHGSSCLQSIMPKVLSALETLESFANKNEMENEKIIALQKSVESLEREKREKMADRVRFEEELEAIEENYRKEINELRQMVKSLAHENKELSSTVSSMPAFPESPVTVKEDEIRRMLELREMSLKQKEEIKQLQRDVHTYSCEVENLENSIEKLIRQNEELLRKNTSLQKQGRLIVEEKMEILKRLEKTEESNIQLRKLLSESDRACKDLQQQSAMDDEPRFTLAELREVLQEKNVLKGRVMELEEEIENLRTGGHKHPRLDKSEEPEDARPSSSNADQDDESPVYGPLPREPEEKLFPWKFERNNSGVRRLFSRLRLFGENRKRNDSRTPSQKPRNSGSPLSFRFFKDLSVSAPSTSPRPSSAQGGSPRPVRSLAGLMTPSQSNN